MVLQGFCAHLQRLMDIMRQVSLQSATLSTVNFCKGLHL
jgi:hypothetical protein